MQFQLPDGSRIEAPNQDSLKKYLANKRFAEQKDSIMEQIDKTSQKYHFPPDMFHRQLIAEAGGRKSFSFRADIVYGITKSSAGATGICQFMEPAARESGLIIDGKRDDRVDPIKAIPACGSYMNRLNNKYKDINLALAAYNWGPSNVDRYLKGEADLPDSTIDYIKFITGEDLPKSKKPEEVSLAPPVKPYTPTPGGIDKRLEHSVNIGDMVEVDGGFIAQIVQGPDGSTKT